MKRKNHFVYALLIGCVLLTGCGSTSNTTTSGEDTVISDSQASTSINEETVTQSTESTMEQLASSTITGIIESMDDSSITVMTMNRPDGEAPQGNTPNGKAPNGEMPDGEMPTGEALDIHYLYHLWTHRFLNLFPHTGCQSHQSNSQKFYHSIKDS